ncbi:GlxA family transcriptional regulator [Halofilum ochraceum]|uniref:GlxA family transcriptional regulator n=1 Tax=Halofilum ochraceum TaxID=1611323 RepID=UPI0008D9BCAC|nr:helix-turn-helix domain-containing protein [Halofilum ochraceum]
MTATSVPVKVGLVAVPEAAPAVLYSLHEVLGSVGRVWEAVTGEAAPARALQPLIIAEHQAAVCCRAGVTVTPDASFAAAGALDVLIVPDLAVGIDEELRGRWPAAAAWIRARYDAGTTVCSVCTGSLLLAEAGLLDGIEATTHWSARSLFERHYPGVLLRPERILVPSGREHRIITSGGFASWAELALYLVARFSGRAEAVRIAKVFVLGDRSDGQLPFSAMIRPTAHSDSLIERCQAWIAYHYADPAPVQRMVAYAGVSARTFKRRFRAATGYSPIEYVQTVRIEEAKHILETTTQATDEVAAEVGYQDPASFRRLFKQLTGLTPARYRQRFAAIGGPQPTREDSAPAA